MSEDVAVTASTFLNGAVNGSSHFGDFKGEWPSVSGAGTTANGTTTSGGQMMTLSPPAGDGAGLTGSTAPEATSSASDLSGDAEGVWSIDIDQAFQEALAIYPPCGRRKIIISDEGKMYGRNELIARYIKLRCGKTRTRKQVSSHIQVLARKKMRDEQAKKKSEPCLLPQLSSMTSPSLPAAPPTVTSTASPPRILPTPFNLTPQLPKNSSIPAATSEQLSQQLLFSSLNPALWPFPNGGLPGQLPFGMDLSQLVVPKQEMPAVETETKLKPVATSSLELFGFSAYVQCNKTSEKRELVRLENTLEEESISISLFYEKYPEVLQQLFEKSPRKDIFFLAKCWANIDVPDDVMNFQYAVDSIYSSSEKFHLKISTMACSFGKQVVEKIEAYPPSEVDGKFHFVLKNSPMCDYMVKFISELKKLENIEYMNSVLENFTVLQVVTNNETNEPLMVICFVFEVSREVEPSCSIFRLTE